MPCPFCHNQQKSKFEKLLLHWKAILKLYDEWEHSQSLVIHNIKTGNFSNEWKKVKRIGGSGQQYFVVSNPDYQGFTIFDNSKT